MYVAFPGSGSKSSPVWSRTFHPLCSLCPLPGKGDKLPAVPPKGVCLQIIRFCYDVVRTLFCVTWIFGIKKRKLSPCTCLGNQRLVIYVLLYTKLYRLNELDLLTTWNSTLFLQSSLFALYPNFTLWYPKKDDLLKTKYAQLWECLYPHLPKWKQLRPS